MERRVAVFVAVAGVRAVVAGRRVQAFDADHALALAAHFAIARAWKIDRAAKVQKRADANERSDDERNETASSR
jgi:hypothetical protein